MDPLYLLECGMSLKLGGLDYEPRSEVMQIINEWLLKSARSGKLRAGKNSLIKHLTGNRLTQRQAISAKCFDCNGMGESNSCDLVSCPLLPFSPYRDKGEIISTAGARSETAS